MVPKDKIITENDSSLYGYLPTEWICILFIALFGTSARESFPLPIACKLNVSSTILLIQ